MNASKGLTMIRDGSIVGLSVNWDASMTGKLSGLNIIVKKGATAIWTNALTTTTGTNKKDSFTQERGTDDFVSEDIITIWFNVSGMMGASMDLTNVIATLEYYYDD